MGLRGARGWWRAGVVELWAFLGSFREMLGLDAAPSIGQLEAALLVGWQPQEALTWG